MRVPEPALAVGRTVAGRDRWQIDRRGPGGRASSGQKARQIAGRPRQRDPRQRLARTNPAAPHPAGKLEQRVAELDEQLRTIDDNWKARVQAKS